MSNLTAGIVVVIALLGGFYGGFRYESAKVPAATTNASAANGVTGGAGTGTGRGVNGGGAGGGGAAGGAGGGFAGRGGVGTITNLTATGFTLHNANGTDIKVTFGSGATVRMTVAGQITDLKDNLNVTVTGARDASGNITATAITIVPAPTASPAAGG